MRLKAVSYEALALSRSSSETNSHDTGLNKSLLVLVFYFRPFCQFQPSHDVRPQIHTHRDQLNKNFWFCPLIIQFQNEIEKSFYSSEHIY